MAVKVALEVALEVGAGLVASMAAAMAANVALEVGAGLVASMAAEDGEAAEVARASAMKAPTAAWTSVWQTAPPPGWSPPTRRKCTPTRRNAALYGQFHLPDPRCSSKRRYSIIYIYICVYIYFLGNGGGGEC